MTDNTFDDKKMPPTKIVASDQTKANEPKTDNANKSASTTSSATDASASASKSTANKANSSATSKTAAKPEAAMKKVDIAIAGVNYSVFCPVNEESELREAVYYINDFTVNIKRESPNLKQENLLVLACLNLYEKIHANNKMDVTRKQDSDQTEALLNKVIADAQSIL
ncbi:cell division protein ZapA [Psychrobacter sp. M13]|uniref:cell division protein ZapA n=1 Tax=Psychrobacter sp. M13 TaxID=3067275 RepID=UPI00273C7361|nr:cell division protein ZapA [Psychrobacter sp. M13]WLP94063.1 cell division protein ZapA [Psychrobacter sp. M13]